MATFVKTPEGFWQRGDSGLVRVTDPVQLRDLSSGAAPYLDTTAGPGAAAATIPSPVGTASAAPQAPAVPAPAPNVAPAPAGGGDPYSKFNTAIMGLLSKAQGLGDNTALYASRDQLNNQSLNLANPLNDTPYKSLFAAMTPGDAMAASRGTEAAFAPGISSINTQIQAGNDAATKFGTLANLGISLTKPQEVAPGSSLVTPQGQQVYDGTEGLIKKQSIDTVFNLAQTYPDAGILPTDSLQIAQQKAARTPRYQAQSTKIVFDPVTGQYITPGAGGGFDVSGDVNRKAIGAAQTEQQTSLSNIRTAIGAADSNFQLLLDTAKRAGINSASSPVANALVNAVQAGYIGNGELNQYYAGLNTLRTEYALVLARGGQVTDATRKHAEELIPDNISLANLQKVYQYIKTEGANVLAEREKEVQNLGTQLGGGSTTQGQRIRVKIGNQTGTIDASEFDPSTMTKI